jgi:TonB family protein
MREPVEVTVRVAVDRNGAVKNVSYISPDEGSYFARTAVRAAHLWKFVPPERNGNPQSSTWVLHFTFSPTKTKVEAKEYFR